MRRLSDTLLGMLCLLCVSTSLGLSARLFAEEPLSLFAAYHGTVPQDVQVVSAEEAHRLYDNGGTVFVDAREWERYAFAHIPGAIHLPVDDFTEYQNELIYLRTSHKVVVLSLIHI